jgi:hypothetical protein
VEVRSDRRAVERADDRVARVGGRRSDERGDQRDQQQGSP